MLYDDYTRQDLLHLVRVQSRVLDSNRERIAHLEQAALSSGLVERAALALWNHAAADLLLLNDADHRVREEYVAEIASRCWYAAKIFASAAGLPHGPTKKGGA
jgi:hypothetical protein